LYNVHLFETSVVYNNVDKADPVESVWQQSKSLESRDLGIKMKELLVDAYNENEWCN